MVRTKGIDLPNEMIKQGKQQIDKPISYTKGLVFVVQGGSFNDYAYEVTQENFEQLTNMSGLWFK